MTFKLAITGKSGSGKTTIVKAFLRIFQELFPEKSILLFDNDLSSELGHSFGLDVRNTIYGIRSGKHEYKTGIPENMSKQEFIEWAMEDILVEIADNVDLIVSWFVGSKDCRCPITGQINDAVLKLINRYDIVIFDCEFDLKYLNQLVDTNIDTTLIVANPSEESAYLAKRIEEFSAKYAAGNQLGVVINKIENNNINAVYDMLKKYDLDVLGVIPYDNELETCPIEKDSKPVQDAIKQFYFRLNLPQVKN
ncbi:TPA: AAA family ATPase [Candidatus Scatousia excrementigallinarum]|uniref:AAA family ATPase n=1 Tax=Candidatus Scatousia excrementigallinarum TaxID=2840935 RepID=A0A9D1F028_9BACT|nr:AAA family ATPase [Candidatus Scatousia excrementigallinarum]